MFLYMTIELEAKQQGCMPYLRMYAVSRISAAKLETFASIELSIEILANNCLMRGNHACSAGTKLPTCAMMVIRAIDRM